MNYESALKILKEKGYLLSTPRLVILKYVLENRTHHTAESVYDSIKKEFPTISLATVYNTLKILAKEGIVVQINISENKLYYDSNTHDHAHFLCVKCGKIEDIDFSCDPASSMKEYDGNKIHYHHIYFYGICRDCLKKESRS